MFTADISQPHRITKILFLFSLAKELTLPKIPFLQLFVRIIIAFPEPVNLDALSHGHRDIYQVIRSSVEGVGSRYEVPWGIF